MFFIGNRFKEKHLLVSESYCRIAIVLFIYVSYTSKYVYTKSLKIPKRLSEAIYRRMTDNKMATGKRDKSTNNDLQNISRKIIE